jgi:hypothetical protein
MDRIVLAVLLVQGRKESLRHRIVVEMVLSS